MSEPHALARHLAESFYGKPALARPRLDVVPRSRRSRLAQTGYAKASLISASTPVSRASPIPVTDTGRSVSAASNTALPGVS
jgi:hypothetical protein